MDDVPTSPEGFSPAYETYLRTLKPLFSTPRIDWPEDSESSTTKVRRFPWLGVLGRLLRQFRFGLVPFVRPRP